MDEAGGSWEMCPDCEASFRVPKGGRWPEHKFNGKRCEMSGQLVESVDTTSPVVAEFRRLAGLGGGTLPPGRVAPAVAFSEEDPEQSLTEGREPEVDVDSKGHMMGLTRIINATKELIAAAEKNLKTAQGAEKAALERVLGIYKKQLKALGEAHVETSKLALALTEAAGERIPETAEEWELYSDNKGAAAAATALTAAMKKAMADLEAGLKKTGDDKAKVKKLLGKVWKEHMKPLLQKYRNLGAEDTEPDYHSKQPLIARAKSYCGWYGYMEELADEMS